METTQNVYKAPAPPAEVPSIREMLEEEISVSMTREEVLFLRKTVTKRIGNIQQAINDVKTSPQRRRARYEEYKFLRRLQDHLMGVSTGFDDVDEEIREELEQQAQELERKASEVRALAGMMKKL